MSNELNLPLNKCQSRVLLAYVLGKKYEMPFKSSDLKFEDVHTPSSSYIKTTASSNGAEKSFTGGELSETIGDWVLATFFEKADIGIRFEDRFLGSKTYNLRLSLSNISPKTLQEITAIIEANTPRSLLGNTRIVQKLLCA
jgi:hypothetical protein